jgi:hypothetical protein
MKRIRRYQAKPATILRHAVPLYQRIGAPGEGNLATSVECEYLPLAGTQTTAVSFTASYVVIRSLCTHRRLGLGFALATMVTKAMHIGRT